MERMACSIGYSAHQQQSVHGVLCRLFDNVSSCLWLRSANVNMVDNFYWTPLHMAAHSGVRNVVEYLIDHGASLEAKSLTGATPIMKAIETCNLDIVQLFINRGAKVRTEDMCCKLITFFLLYSLHIHASLTPSDTTY